MTHHSIETIGHLDFDFESPCEATGISFIDPEWSCHGQNTAEWIVRSRCECHWTKLMCDKCTKKRMFYVRDLLFCPGCGIRNLTSDQLYESFEKIK